jgi:Domain of unknown function (DUF4349)
MIDEETLAGLLADHAERIPVPASAIDALLAAAPELEAPTTRARQSARVLAAAAVTVVLAATAVWTIGTRSGSGSGQVKVFASGSRPVTAPPAPKTVTRADRGVTSDSTSGAPDDRFRYDSVDGGVAARSSAKPSAAAPLSADHTAALSNTSAGTTLAAARVVRTGALDVRIARHAFGTTIGRITTIAASAGGFIADAKTFESAAVPSGTITIRIPSARFNATVTKLRALGTVVSASTRGVDVSGQYTDLQARLRAVTATREQFLAVLSRATNIGDILAVQDRILGVQTEIEQREGQIRQLDDQTTYGTVTVSVAEPGPRPNALPRPRHRSGLAIAWGEARNGFARRVEGLISHSGSALVVLGGLLLVGGMLRLVVPRMRRMLV